MELIDTLTVLNKDTERSISLFSGDLARLPATEAVDVLVVSAFPNDYTPTTGSLIGALDHVGVSIAKLAADKEVDLRQYASCWLSRPIDMPGVHFRRVLCFEPPVLGRSTEVVGDIFRSLAPFAVGPEGITVAMPLVASGDQGEPPAVMLEALIGAAAHWLSTGLPMNRIKIVIRDTEGATELKETFTKVKQLLGKELEPRRQAFAFDVFCSYSHKNKEAVDALVSTLQEERPGLRIFIDRLELKPGAAWQQHIFEALDASRKVICAFSPDYLSSKVCKEEFNIALMRHRETDGGVVVPVYLFSADLPGYMKQLQYEDAREGDSAKIRQCVKNLLEQW